MQTETMAGDLQHQFFFTSFELYFILNFFRKKITDFLMQRCIQYSLMKILQFFLNRFHGKKNNFKKQMRSLSALNEN